MNVFIKSQSKQTHTVKDNNIEFPTSELRK